MIASSKLMRFLDAMRTLAFTRLGVRTLGAMAVLIDDDDKLLLIKQTYGHGAWTFPGGGVGRHESFLEAAIREAGEEAGVVTRPSFTAELLGLYSKRRGRWHDHIAVYVIRGWDATPSPNREIAEVGRFDLDQIPSDAAPSTHRRIAEWKGLTAKSEDW